MNSFYSKLLEALNQNQPVILATAVDSLVEFSDSYDVLIAQKAFRCGQELTAETPSMKEFWQSVFSAMPETLPDLFAQDSWWAFFDALECPFPAGVLEKLAAGDSMVLATAITRAGSHGAFAAAKLAVAADGTVFGSFGDAGIDTQVVQTAQAVQAEYTPRLLECPMNGDTLRILLDPIN